MEVRAGYKQTELGVIPDDWGVSTLSQLSGFITKGATPTTYGYKWETSGVLFLRSECVAEDGLDLTQSMYISPAAHVALRRGEVLDGDILVTITGNVGRVVWLQGVGSANLNQHIARVRINASHAEPRYVYHFLSQPSVRRHFNSITTGQAYPQLSLVQVRETQIAMPSFKEQHAIATALSDVDALLAAQEKLIAKKRDIKQAAKQQLLTGKQRLPGFSGAWEVKRLGDVAELKNGFAFKSSTYTELGQFKVITIANVQNGYMTVEECNKVADIPADLQRHQKLMRRDILISMTGNVGRVCRVAEDDCLLNQRVGKLVPYAIDDDFFFSQLCQPTFAAEMTLRATGGAQGNLGKSDIVDYELAVPGSVEEQTAIATILSDMDAEIVALEQQRDKTRALKQGMMQELLTGRIRLV
jgi:type I restriction enzyme S subunit